MEGGLLAIVPAFDEAGTVRRTVSEIREWAPEFDVLVIDDGSTDETSAAAMQAGAQVIRLPFNLGIGGAVQTGYLYARDHGYSVAVQVDGDGQHDPRDIRRLLAHLQEHPDLMMVTGSRFLEPRDGGYRSSAARRAGIRLFSLIVSLACRERVTDPTSGFRMTDRRGIELFARDYPHDYPEVETILLMHTHRLRGTEVPVAMRVRTSGASSISTLRAGYYMVKVLLALVVALLRARPAPIADSDPPVTGECSL